MAGIPDHGREELIGVDGTQGAWLDHTFGIAKFRDLITRGGDEIAGFRLAGGSTAGRSPASAGAAEQSASRADSAVWLVLAGTGALEASGAGPLFQQTVDANEADVPWSRVAAVLAIDRRCAQGSELAIEERWYPSMGLDDLLVIEEGKIDDTRL